MGISGDNMIDHIISLAGYGIENGTPYWVIRNSWGTYWGHVGWGRVVRGKNNIMIEENCAFAVPDNQGEPVWQHANTSRVYAIAQAGLNNWQEIARETKVSAGDMTAAVSSVEYKLGKLGKTPPTLPPAAALPPAPAPAPAIIPGSPAVPPHFSKKAQPEGVAISEQTACRVPWNDWESVGGERVLTARPQLAAEDRPQAWDWRNVSGVNYATWDKTQNEPNNCSSCWAQAVTSVLSDRLSIARRGAWPVTDLSPQVLINCRGGGTCMGGNPAGAYAYIHEHGITDATCQNYQATQHIACNERGLCENCAPGNLEGRVMWPGHCVAVQSPIVHFVSEYGSVRGAANMKAEIYKRGPIGCGVDATHDFQRYAGGIYSEFRHLVLLNTHVSVAGWGVASLRESVPEGTEFWHGRHSVGSNWGERGWFRIVMHTDNLGIESDCDWGIPLEAATVPSTEVSSESLQKFATV